MNIFNTKNTVAMFHNMATVYNNDKKIPNLL